jgi:sec-independent protein translocase protein TatC
MTATSQRPQQVDPKSPDDFSGAEMSLIEHLGELRTRLIRSAVGIILGMIVSFVFIDRIYNALINLALPYKVQAIAPTETFTSYIKVSLMLGLVFAMPIIVYQIVAFISPGLTRKERQYLLRALPFVSLLFFGGLAFAYFVVLPSALGFLLGFGDPRIITQPRLSDYISFVTNLLIWVGVSFEMPVIVYTLIKLNIVSANKLASLRKYVMLLIVIAAAIITPTPDPLNMMLVAGPMYILFELGIVIGRIGTRNRDAEA